MENLLKLDNLFTDPSGEGFGLPYDTEFCYEITSVNVGLRSKI